MMNYKAIEKLLTGETEKESKVNQTGSIQRSDSIQHGDE